jgi:2-polyprenyl-6-hydroxyphenyl methylase/3-demethylubiquinone-9 3-methyltransferase
MIDNQWYDQLGDTWWDERGPLGLLHEMNPARFDYFQSVVGSLSGLKVLDVGCGGGILAERFAQAGALVTGVDLSYSSLAAASRHSKINAIEIDYVNAEAEMLPFPDSSFDLVVSSDFLEHVIELDRVISECARVLRPRGLFLYDTINRTFLSRVMVIWLIERTLGLVPKMTHNARMFIRPSELHQAMARHGISNCETRGLVPKAGRVATLLSLIRKGSAGAFTIADNTAISYVGYGVKSD